MNNREPFVTAQWRDLVLLNYEVPAALLEALVPAGTTLDAYDGRIFASIVGFRFLDTRLRGWRVPFHRAFEEVNLRFYVQRQASTTEARRAVVFVRELVPKPAVAWIARMAYNEPYQWASMAHRIDSDGRDATPTAVEYRWRFGGGDYLLGGRFATSPAPLRRPSEQEFITEHYWGYTRQRDGGTLEYRVAHPSWSVADLVEPRFTGDVTRLYGPAWAEVLSGGPSSAYYADGSAVEVYPGQRLSAGFESPPKWPGPLI